jgi:hypothetical protein
MHVEDFLPVDTGIFTVANLPNVTILEIAGTRVRAVLVVGRDPVRLPNTNVVDNVVVLLIPAALFFILPVGSAFPQWLDSIELDVFEDNGLVATV